MAADDQVGSAKPGSHLDPAKGGRARAEKLTAEERQDIARKAAQARWSEGVLKVLCGSANQPLRIGEMEIPCYVLSDESRVITQQGVINALGMSRGGSGGRSGSRLANFVSGQALSAYFPDTFDCGMQPIRFQTPEGGFAYGFPAPVLAQICEAVLASRADGVLHHNQEHIAKRCEILARGFMHVGIIALVDEATGFQKIRARYDLEQILERFISKELLKWAKIFPDDFYEEMFRLKTWEYRELSSKRPVQAGKLTNDVVYERLAPGVLDELRLLVPRDDKGRLKHRLHQRLTEDVGHPRLREHLSAVIALMRASDDWHQFYRSLQRALPKKVNLPLFDTHGGHGATDAGAG